MQEPYQYGGFIHNQRLMVSQLETFPITVSFPDSFTENAPK